MAVVVVGNLGASIREVDDRLEMGMVQGGAGMPAQAQAVYMLPGPHRFDVLVWLPGGYWSRPHAKLSTQLTLEACHVYVPVGSHDEGGANWATLIDLGKGFDPACVGTPTLPSSAIRFSDDQRKLLVAEYCYASWGESAGANAPPREFLLSQPPVAP